ncbi:MAG: MipA/OmpV family protein, partial [Stenotrophobium sp.]
MNIRGWLSLAAGSLCVAVPVSAASAAGFAPLAEWQSSAGVLFEQAGGEMARGWNNTLGVGVSRLAAYPGADSRRTFVSPVIDIRYRDRWFASTEEGLGFNFPGPSTVRTGLALGYDFGRPSSSGPAHDLPGINAAPEIKFFAEKLFMPVVVRGDLRRALGGYGGWVADLSGYAALPLGQSVVIFAGPSITAADSRYFRSYYARPG